LLLFIDNVFRYMLAGTKSRPARRCRRRWLPAHAGHRDGRPRGADHLDQKARSPQWQAVFVPADDYTDPAIATTSPTWGPVSLSRAIVERGIYPRSIRSIPSHISHPRDRREEHYRVARGCAAVLQRNKDCRTYIAILGPDELSEDDKLLVARARKIERFLSQRVFVAEIFTNRPASTCR